MIRFHPARRRARALLAGVLIGSALFAPGCGGGGSDDDNSLPPGVVAPDPVGAQQQVENGRNALNTLLQSETPPSAQSLQGVRSTFADAYARDPANAQAAFGYGLSEVAAAVQHFAEESQGSGLTAGALGRAIHPLSGQKLRLPDGADLISRMAGAPLLRRLTESSSLSPGRHEAGASERDNLLLLRAALDRAIPAITVSANTAGFTFMMADPWENAPATAAQITVDQADAQAFLALLYVARGGTGAAVAYQFDVAGFDFNEAISQRFAAKADGDTVTPDEYLPPAPFLNLASDGQAFMASAKADLSAGVDNGLTAEALFRARTVKTGHLIDAENTLDLAQFRASLLVFKDALSNPYQISSQPPVTVNLNAWFTNPPASLRALLPTYRVARSGPSMNLVTGPADFPDKTFGGLFVGLPDETFVAGFQGYEPVSLLSGAAILSGATLEP